ncbi:MAG: UDP-N-acetylglucosamine 2-epimerase [Cytophagaceae bacterium]|jgi:GDP/UDP-N,N'-diacetylbacillosamine 2-epimerase (hydrolysing)|nr:UDP-N-acetylglucosamine 2-epimerase [Cytophagaceae bacterium]
MGGFTMNVAVLTSSRAEYGIYYPLLKRLQEDDYFNLEIIAFGTHLSKDHGHTIDFILSDGFEVNHRLSTIPQGDTSKHISSSIGNTIDLFSSFWSEHSFDLIFALGDRYEMFAAVTAAFPFNKKIAHISGGETTLGAIDNAFRHAISLMSSYHFASTEIYKNRIIQVIGTDKNVFNVGALNIENFIRQKYYTLEEFYTHFKIDLSKPSILITFHPETVALEKNISYTEELIKALEYCSRYQLIITMPNSDTMGNVIRKLLHQFIVTHPNAIGIESFGMIGYMTCMKYCTMMLGNTSSGFVEAAFFPKYVINIGDRQKGRIQTPNILNVPVEKDAILQAVQQVETSAPPERVEVYGKGDTAEKIIEIIKQQ